MIHLLCDRAGAGGTERGGAGSGVSVYLLHCFVFWFSPIIELNPESGPCSESGGDRAVCP